MKKPNQQSLMMKFTTCSQSSTAAARSKYTIESSLRSGQTSNWIEVTMQIDSGSEANYSRMEDFVKIQNKPDLKKTRAILKAYNGGRIFPKVKSTLTSRLDEK